MSIYYDCLEAQMRAHSLTASALCRAVPSVSPSNLSSWKSGKATPSISALCDLADFFGVTVDALCGRNQRADELELLRIYRSVDTERKAAFLAAVYAARDNLDSFDLEAELRRALIDNAQDAQRAQAEAGLKYSPYAWIDTVNEKGAVRAVKDLIHAPVVANGFVNLYTIGRLDLTPEYIAIQTRFSPLFTDDDIAAARARLADVGFDTDAR